MRKLMLTLFAAILMVLGTALTIKAFNLATTSTAAQRPNPTVAQAGTEAKVPTTKITAAPIIDRDTTIFLGTGDASAGSWSRP
jgi:hypothetical protein